MIRHTRQKKINTDYQLEAGLYICGHDINFRDLEGNSRVHKLTSRMLSRLDIEHIMVQTNIREFSNKRWYLCAASGVSSCMILLSNYFNYGLVPSTITYLDEMRHTFSPLIGPLLSSRKFIQVYDGSAFSRISKIKTISDYPDLIQELRVCYMTYGRQADKNCGVCNKCIRTALAFRIIDRPIPRSLSDITDDKIRTMKVDIAPTVGRVQTEDMKLLIKEAKERNINDSWVNALEEAYITKL